MLDQLHRPRLLGNDACSAAQKISEFAGTLLMLRPGTGVALICRRTTCRSSRMVEKNYSMRLAVRLPRNRICPANALICSCDIRM